jgi:diguanylate cyclase (GGDEF)-like protein
MLIKKNLWTVFYLIVFGGVLLFTTLTYLKYSDILDSYHLKYRHYTEMVAQSSHSLLLQNELLLEILGTQLLEDDKYTDREASQKIFDRLLKLNPALAGFGLIDTNGNYLSTSSNIDLSKMSNLLSDPQTKNSFKEALLTDRMVLGRTYYVKGIGKWVIPLRKSILDKDGNVLGVMVTGLQIDNEKSLLNKIHLSQTDIIVIVKDFDYDKKMYRQFMNWIELSTVSYEEVYNVPVPSALIESVKAHIKEKYDVSLPELRELGNTVSFEGKDNWGREVLTGLLYDSKYQLWVLVRTESSIMNAEVRKMFLIYLLIFLLSYATIYGLFKYIAQSQKRTQDELVFQAMHDDLTKLPNRTYLYHDGDRWVKRFSGSFDMLCIDLDNFKNINDSFGHKFGDEILKEVAKRLSSYFGDSALVVRQGGDEFIILIHDGDDVKKKKILEDVIYLISQPYTIEQMEFSIGSSIGTAQFPRDAQNIEELMSLADIAMYEAKKKKNSFCIFSHEMQEQNLRKADIEHELRNAVKNNELWMVYQPQIKSDGNVHGVEALVRWKNEKLGFVSPDQFIPVVEETGLMPEIGEFIIRTSLQEIKALQEKVGERFQLSINISVRQLIEVDFLEKFLDQLKACNFNKSLVTLEITESLFIEDVDYILGLLQEIKDEGIGLSLDDFGTGYSSLNILRKLPINELKIDKSFVDEMLNIDEDKAMVESIVSMGKNLSMDTLAEGVETKVQADMLRDFGCDIFQGYYFSKPLEKDDLADFLKDVD